MKFLGAFFFLALTPYLAEAGTITISATGVTGSPIFVTSTLSSITVGTQFNLGTFKDATALANTIATYKAGVNGTGTTTALAQADADNKKTQLYNDTVTWLSSTNNFIDLPSAANSITQTGTTAAGKFLFNNSTNRTVNGVSGTYAGANGSLDVTYANYGGGTGAKLWAWFGTGTEIAIVTDITWLIPVNNSSGLTVGSANLISSGSGDATELLLANYVDYASGIDLISSVAMTQTLTVIPEPSVGSLLVVSIMGFVLSRKRSGNQKCENL